MDNASTTSTGQCTMVRMDLDTWCDLDSAYTLIFGHHPDLDAPPSAAGDTLTS